MGAALHLAHAHQPLEKKRKPKRKDGGDGPKFAEYAQRIYQDERADASARFLLLTIAYVLTMVPLDDDTTVWKATGKALGTRPHHWRRTSLRELVRDDVPRYEPPGYRHGTDPLDRVCRGPRMRPHPDGPEDFRNAMKVCGAPAVPDHRVAAGGHLVGAGDDLPAVGREEFREPVEIVDQHRALDGTERGEGLVRPRDQQEPADGGHLDPGVREPQPDLLAGQRAQGGQGAVDVVDVQAGQCVQCLHDNPRDRAVP
ncbi:hypothetical protein XF35_38935, partial [Streptomyces platensis subsp. clarensis]|nr:hypothetical protein [Streptomyces platensis subsp. clarensis]